MNEAATIHAMPSQSLSSPKMKPRANSCRPIAGVGRVLLWHGASLWIGRATSSVSVHSHHAIQITLALSGVVQLRDEGESWSDYAGALVPPHQRHQFDGCNQYVGQLFVEPETVHGRALLERYTAQAINRLPEEAIAPVARSLRQAYEAGVTDAALIAAGQRAVAALSGDVPVRRAVDPRIGRAIAFVQSRRGAPTTMAEAARTAHLSPSRFRHLFMEQTGISFRAYLLWTRVGSAVAAAMGGVSWTDAAQDWGFADSAHLTRTCRRMFGLAPSMLVREPNAPKR